jgi:ETC complex I subunit conserved region
MRVRIFQRTKSAMQSGRAATDQWIMEGEPETPRRPDPLMGWISAGDTLGEISVRFPTKEDAVAFAEKNGWEYSVDLPKPRRVRPRNYADNFRYERPQNDPNLVGPSPVGAPNPNKAP